MFLTPERSAARNFLANWWPSRARAETLLVEYGALEEVSPNVLADLARFCNAGDSSLSPDPLRLAANEGRREVWLHIRAMARLDESDTDNLLERTET